MGTKVHCKTFLPEHCTTGEVNVDATRGWPMYYEDRALSMQFCNGLASMLIGCPGYEKEVLKQTMLKHEAIFRTQVYELHRLYRIQRELTEELRRKDFWNYSMNVQAAQSGTIPSMWNSLKSQCLPVASSNFSRPSSTSNYNPQKTMKCFSTEAEPSPVPSESSFWYDSDALHPEIRRPKSVVIDLQLPGDAYLHVGNTRGVDTIAFSQKLFPAIDPSETNCNVRTEKDTMFGPVSSEFDDGPQCEKLSPSLHNSQKSRNLSDLNIPTDSSSNSPLYQEGLDQHLDLFNQERKASQVIHFEKGFPSFLEMDDGVKRQKLWFSNHESGDRNGIDYVYNETAKKFAKPMKSEESYQFALSNKGSSGARLKDRSNGTGKSLPANSICTALTMPQMTCPVSSSSECDKVNITFPLASSLKVPKDSADNVPVSDNQPACFWGSINKIKIEDLSYHKPASACDKQKFIFPFLHSTGYHDGVPSEMKSSLESLPIISSCKKNETVNLSHPSTSKNGTQFPLTDLHGNSRKPVKDIDLNLAIPDELSDTFNQENAANKFSDAKDPVSGLLLSKLNTSGDCPDGLTNVSHSAFALVEGNSVIMPMNNMKLKDLKIDKEGSNLLHDHPAYISQKKGISHVPGDKKIFGISALDNSFNNATTDLHPTDLSSKMNHYDLENQLPEEIVVTNIEKSSATGRAAINLNSVDPIIDCALKSPNNISAEETVPWTLHDSGVGRKRNLVIDLELPAELFSEEAEACKSGTPEDHLAAPVTVTNDNDELKIQGYDTIKMAANAIVQMSSIICEHPESISHLPLEQVSANCLHWFADVVSSHIGESTVPSTGEADNCEGSGDDGLDFLEAMTLKLVETKVDDLLSTIPDKENQKDDSGMNPCLLTKARRGQARKRRQRRDFQKDVLPGLASLSRHEVSEDIQTIGGMMRAVGQPWQSGVARRNAGRIAGGCQVKGRRRQRGCGGAATEVVMEVPVKTPRKANFAEFEIDATGIMGWGRTRRCRRPRCPPGISVPPALS